MRADTGEYKEHQGVSVVANPCDEKKPVNAESNAKPAKIRSSLIESLAADPDLN